MVVHPTTGGASRPSTFEGWLSLFVAAAIGSAPLWLLIVAGGGQ